MTIQQRINDTLIKKSLKQKDLSEYIGVSTSTLNNWLKLNRSIPSEYIIPISKFLGVSIWWLLDSSNETNKNIVTESTDLSVDEVKEVEKYIEFLKSKRN